MKKARAWLDMHGVDYAFHDYKTAGIARERLERWAKKVGWETSKEVSMVGEEKILERILDGRGAVAFRDLERILRKLGFDLVRTRGSHHIYRHPKVPRHLNIQPIGTEAKPYQIKQLRDMIIEFKLAIEG